MKAHPATELRRPLRDGARVRVRSGVYANCQGVVVECLTPPAAPAYITGASRYGIVLGITAPAQRDAEDPRHNIMDFARHELVALTQRRVAVAAGRRAEEAA